MVKNGGVENYQQDTNTLKVACIVKDRIKITWEKEEKDTKKAKVFHFGSNRTN